MAGRKHSHGSLSFQIEQNENGSLIASVIHEPHRPVKDDVGALYYVVVVIFVYGCSMLMMIASYIRKNKIDQKLNRYLKEMANVRKREQQMQLFQAARKAAEVQRASEGSILIPSSLRGERTRKFSQASDFSDIEEIVTDDEQCQARGIAGAGNLTAPLIHESPDGRKSPTGGGHGRKGMNNVRILCREEVETKTGFPQPDQVQIKAVTVFEPRTGKSVQLWLRQGAPGRASPVKKRESPEGEEITSAPSLSDSENPSNQGDESMGSGDESSDPSGSFQSDCQIVTSV